MTQAEWTLLALQLAVILALALGMGQLFRWMGQPSIVGELLGGILVGPTVLGRLSPETYQAFLPTAGDTADARNGVLRIGMLFFIFTIGADISLKGAFAVRKEALSIGIAGTLTPLALGFGLALGLPAIIQAPAGREVALAGFFGAILSLSANPVIARILLDLGLYKHRIGTLIMSSTLVDDFIGWGIFAVLLAQYTGVNAGKTPAWFTVLLVFTVVGAILFVGRVMMPALIRATKNWGTPPMATLMALMAFTLFSAAAAEFVGVHSFLGAFIAGLALSDVKEEFEEAFNVTSKFALSVFTPLFFFSMGIAADFIKGFDLALVLLITAIAFAGKIAGVYLGGRLAKLGHRESLAVGAGLNARGILGLIMAGSALQAGLIDQRIFVACVVMCLVTTMAAGPALQLIMRKKLVPVPVSHA